MPLYLRAFNEFNVSMRQTFNKTQHLFHNGLLMPINRDRSRCKSVRLAIPPSRRKLVQQS